MRWVTPIFLFIPIFSYSQPLVHHEPHHIPIFENRFVRLMEVSANVGDTTGFHIHKNDISYFTITGSKIWLQELGKDGRSVELHDGWAGSDTTHSDNPMIHRFANIGSQYFQLVAVEILTNKFYEREFTQLGKQLFENTRFSIQQIDQTSATLTVPSILIELSKSGELIGLDYVKPNRNHLFDRKNEVSTLIIIQAK